MEQQPYGNPGPGGYPPPGGYHQPPGYQPHPPEPPKRENPNIVMAALSLVFGIFAMFLPIPVLDVLLGVAGLVLAVLALKSGSRGLAIAGLICSIIGTLFAISFTLEVLRLIPAEWQL